MEWDEAASNLYKRTWPHDGSLAVLPFEWQREIVALMKLGDEIMNGGYLQFFTNRGHEYYRYASRALKAIGAHRTAAIIDNCQVLLDEHAPNGGKSSEDRFWLMPNEVIGLDGTTKKEAGSVLPDSVVERIYELSYEFMSFPDDYGELAQAYYAPMIEADKPT